MPIHSLALANTHCICTLLTAILQLNLGEPIAPLILSPIFQQQGLTGLSPRQQRESTARELKAVTPTKENHTNCRRTDT